MAGYYSGTIKKGSQGDDVRKWQEFLKSQGYGINVDGIFGLQTHEMTKNWQMKNSLSYDGIVGGNTWSKAGFKDVNAPLSTPTISAAPTNPTFNSTNYDETDEGIAKKGAMDDALSNFNNFGTNWEYAQTNKDILEKYLNRDPFSYDLNGDALYQQYKDKYIQQGKMAMQDTMGQASAMTGGYGNSYAQSVGQQAYQNSLDNLNDIVPELYQMAYDRYNQQGQDMINQLSVIDADYNRGYTAAKDKYSTTSDNYYNSADMYNANRDTANNLAQKDYENRFDAWDVGNSNAWKQWEADEGTRRWEIENNRADEELQLKKNSLNTGSSSSSAPKTTASDGTKYGTSKPTTTVIPEAKNDNDDKEGSYYTTSLTDLKQMKAKGKSNKEAMAYLSEMQKAGYLTMSEYTSLYNKYRDNRL